MHAGWQYNRSGHLVRATKLKGIRDFKAKDYGLVPLRAAQWLRHFTLVDTSPPEQASPPAAAWLGAPRC
jgi:choline monooxygenase